MKNETNKPNALWQIIKIANPYFVALAIIIPIAALIFALNRPSLTPLNYVHVMTGALWTGIDLFMVLVLVRCWGESVRKSALTFSSASPRK